MAWTYEDAEDRSKLRAARGVGYGMPDSVSLLGLDEPWMKGAACARPGVDPDWFCEEDRGPGSVSHTRGRRKQIPDHRAFDICGQCPVKAECAEWKTRVPLPGFVQGGEYTPSDGDYTTRRASVKCLVCRIDFKPKSVNHEVCYTDVCRAEIIRRRDRSKADRRNRLMKGHN